MKIKKVSERKRKVDLNSLSEDQAELVGEQLGKKIGEIGDHAAKKINELTKIYGLSAKVAVQLIDIKTGNTVT